MYYTQKYPLLHTNGHHIEETGEPPSSYSGKVRGQTPKPKGSISKCLTISPAVSNSPTSKREINPLVLPFLADAFSATFSVRPFCSRFVRAEFGCSDISL